MSKRFDISRASVETCREVASLALQTDALKGFAAMVALRAECSPRRTRAEVDAEIAVVVRAHHEVNQGGISCVSPERERSLKRLCAEPTADPEPERKREHSTMPDIPFADPDPAEKACSCPEVERLRTALDKIRRMMRNVGQQTSFTEMAKALADEALS